jgi:23S rRNA (pseudouridine1915-N3)-methyltransferase
MFTILSISDSDKHWQSAIQEYTKRLGKSVKILDIKPSRNGTPQQIIQADTEQMITQLKKFPSALKFLLSKEGKALDTLQFHALCRNQDVVFVIGGPYGLEEEKLLNLIDARIAFGSITLPHGLAKLTLLEQIYRIGTLETGKTYHY